MRASAHNSLLSLTLVCVFAIGCAKVEDTVAGARDRLPLRIQAAHLPNAIRIHEQVISGGQPEGAAAFEELRSLGVKTLISVDGARPNIELAAKYGMRYVHLPHGYNGISAARAAELAKAIRDFEGPIYLHCHHGKHRSPTAAAVACVANGMLEPAAATTFLKFAGTGENYKGLYQSAANARRLDNQLLDALEVDFPEIAELPPLAEAMVELEYPYDHLKRMAAANWKSLDDHPDLDPAHEALILLEHFTELLRMEAVAEKPGEFRVLLEQSAADSRTLETLLREQKTNPTMHEPEINESFKRLSANCAACHQLYRDVSIAP